MERNGIEDAFQECLDALLNGDSVEQALSRHAELADELEPLLETAAFLATTELPPPSVAYQARVRSRFEASVRDRSRKLSRRGSRAFRWIFPTSVAAALALTLLAFGSAAFLADRGNPLDGLSSVAGDGLLVLKPSVLQKADIAIGRIDSAIRNGDAINPNDVKDLQDANAAIVRAVERGSLDSSTKQAVQENAGRQLQVLVQIQETENIEGTPAAENGDAKASITSVVNVVGKALGIPVVPATPVATVTPTEVPQPTPTEAATETPVPTETVQATPTATAEPPTPEPTTTAAAGQPLSQATPSSTPTPTAAPSNPTP